MANLAIVRFPDGQSGRKGGALSSDARVLTAAVRFDPNQLTVGDDKDVRVGLSAVALHGHDLWLACDEGCRLERLSRAGLNPKNRLAADIVATDALNRGVRS